MTTTKIAISLPTELVERTRREVRRGQAASVSAYIASALEEKVTGDELSAMLQEMLAETGGPLTPAEAQEADQALGLRPRRAAK